MTRYATLGILRAPGTSTSIPARRETSSRSRLLAALVVLATLGLGVKPVVSQKPEEQAPVIQAPVTQAPVEPTPSSSIVASDNYWDFGRSDDKDFNQWPDDWQRGTGIGFPKYIKIGIVSHDQAAEAKTLAMDTTMIKIWPKLRETFPFLSNLPPSISDLFVDRFLAIDMDGGQAKVQSPPHPTSQLYQYHFTCRMMTQGLRHDAVQVSLVFLDAKGKEISVLDAPEMRGTNPWTKLEIDRVRPPLQATQMMVRLTVLGSEDGLQDIFGRVGIDDIRIEPFPQLEVSTDELLGVYDFGQPITITAKVLGTPSDSSTVSFRLVDHAGNVLHQHQATSEPKPIKSNANSSNVTDENSLATEGSPEVQWQLPTIQPGFYRVLSSFAEDRSTSLSTVTTLAVIESLGVDELSGPFGWSLPKGDRGIEPREFAEWLHKLGVACVKYPCWFAPNDQVGMERASTLIGRMQSHGTRTIGVLDIPPASELPAYEIPAARDVVAANLFRDRAIWHPRLEPVMPQMSLKVRSWQLGVDRDYSFMGRPRLKEAIAGITDGLQGFGQPLDFAISWPWLEPTLSGDDSGWHANVRSTVDTPLTANELDAFLQAEATLATVRQPATWILLDPIHSDRYSRDARIQDLVMRMAAVRKHDIRVATVTDPYNEDTGLLTEDGRPNDLLLPWRTASLVLGDVRYVGKLALRNGSENQVFAGPKRAVLMMWSPSPNVEEMYLGENVKQIDVWGRVTDVPTVMIEGQKRQRIEVGPMPIFLVDVDATLLAFRMSVAIVEKQIDSLLGQRQSLNVVFTNPSREALVGEMRFRYPKTWQVDTPVRPWELLGATSGNETFEVVLGNAAMVGQYEISFDFLFDTTPPKHITVYRKMNVGVEGLSVKLTTKLTEDDELHVVLELANASLKTLSYDCMMFPPPGRQYQRRFVRIAPQETVTRDFYFSGGRELIGSRMLLRAIEQDGQRVVNFDTLITP